jgi:hypothetical protein
MKEAHLRKALTIAVAAAALGLATAAGAQPHGGAPHGTLHGGDGGQGPQARARWRSGEWRHTWHDGRFGWWWFVDDDWFWFSEPIYPYPDYVAPPEADVALPPPPPLPQPPHYWYRCEAPAGFYPYVTRCPGGWRPVPAAPPPYAQP